MSTIKVNTFDNEGGAVDFPNKLTIRGNAIERTYTSSGTEPSSPSNGDFWYDTGNGVLKHYINSEFKTISFAPPSTWYGARALHAGGFGSSNIIDYFDITSTGNASDFGDLTSSRRTAGAVSDTTYGVFAGGYTSTHVNTIDFVTIATTADAADFGDMTAATRDHMSLSNGDRGLFAGGYTGSVTNKIEYITLGGQTSGNGTDFGDLTLGRYQMEGGMNDATRGVFAATAYNLTMDYVTIATTGDATDFGDGVSNRVYAAATSGDTRGVTGGGMMINTIDYITIQTTGNSTDFGDLTVSRYQLAATSDNTYGVFAGGYDYYGGLNTIDRITIATTGNATDHGDLNKSGNARRLGGMTSGSAS